MNTKIRIVITIILLILISVLENVLHFDNELFLFALFLIPYFFIGYEILLEAIKGIMNREPFNECFLMAVATIGAFGIGEYKEAVLVLLFSTIGELFEEFAMSKSERNITELMKINPDVAYVINNDGTVRNEKPENVEIGTIILVKNGDKIPIDGEIVEGQTLLNTCAITGESIPKQVKVFDEVLSGMINTESAIKIKTNKKYVDSAASKIIELVKNSSEKKSKSENFITEFARIYTPIVCILSLAIFVVPVIANIVLFHRNPEIRIWFYRALTMLVISCPCALVVSIPLAFFSSVGRASKYGILIKGTNYIETLSKIKSIALDKTGTMTKGIFEVVGIHNEDSVEKNEIIRKAAYVEYFSNHPIAKCIKKEFNNKVDIELIKECKEIGGHGLEAYIDGKRIMVGSEKLMLENSIDYKKCNHIGTIVHVAEENKYLGHIVISDVIKKESKESIERLRKLGIKKTIMLTGDTKLVGEQVANEIGVDCVYTDLLPDDKLRIIEEEIKNNKDGKVAFVGDGINDAPVLVRSDIGISMGSIGSDSAVQASDVVIMDDNPIKISIAIRIAKHTMLVNYEIIVFSIFTKISILLLSAIGVSNMWMAMFADVGVLIICVLNSVRLLASKYD